MAADLRVTGEGAGVEFVVVADKVVLVDTAAERIGLRLAAATAPIAVCLTGGSTIEPVYRALAAAPWRDRLPLDRIDWFFGDERMVAPDDPRSNARMARAALLDPLGVPASRIHAIDTSGDGDLAAGRYQDELARFHGGDRLDPERPLFDLVLLGMGSDGHVASLFPGKPATDEQRRWVVGVPEAGLEPFVPRVSLTFPALASSEAVLFVVSGSDKRPALARVIAGDDLPAGRVSSRAVTWVVDRAAAPETAWPSSTLASMLPTKDRE
jgi:6-phosphogluconolactonase